MPRLADRTLADLLEAIAADRPSPGCGAAAAVSLALAAACARKALAISARRQDDTGLRQAGDRAGALAHAALDAADRDAADFAALLRAEGDASGPAHALKDDGRDFLALLETLRRLVREHEARADARLAGDLRAALALAEAAERIERGNLDELS